LPRGGSHLKIRAGFSHRYSESTYARSRECNFISLMDFDARDCNPPFFASCGTENWIIHGFEVMKGNLTRAREKARLRERTERSDSFKNRVDCEKKESIERCGNNDGIRTIQEQRNYSITMDLSIASSFGTTASYAIEQTSEVEGGLFDLFN